MSNKKLITVGIPAFKAEKHICDCLSSIQIQSIRDDVVVIIANDNPGDDYSFVKKRFPDLDITIVDCKENTGPGLARQRCADAAKSEWITWIDADDVFYDPMALENLRDGITPDAIEVQGIFCQEIDPNPMGVRMMPRTDEGHPWVFGRLYNLQFLKSNGISFSKLRAMEDGELN
jgi:glycosyltransferase involved in cell wall biosynthesis